MMFDNIIVVPYRDRKAHLRQFIPVMTNCCKKKLPNTRIVIAEQLGEKAFNRGKIINAAMKEYIDDTEYFFTNDVDLLPTMKIFIDCYVPKKNDIVSIHSSHKYSLGGIIKIKATIMKNINGFPNYIWGWGIEDRALFFRSYIKNYNVIRLKIGKSLLVLPHVSNKRLYSGDTKAISDNWRQPRIDSLSDEDKNSMVMDSGLNNVDYTVKKKTMLNEITQLLQINI